MQLASGRIVRRITRRLLLSLAADIALGWAGSAAAAEPLPEQVTALFGVAPGATLSELDLAVASRDAIACRSPNPQSVVCGPSVGDISLPATETFWIEDRGSERVVDRIYVVASLTGNQLGPALAAFESLSAAAQQQLGLPSAARSWPAWIASRSDADRVQALLAGQVQLERSWRGELMTARVWLAGEEGRLTVVLGVRGAGAKLDCSPARISTRLMQLFPPSAPELRSAAARHLTMCNVTGATGAIDAALGDDGLRRAGEDAGSRPHDGPSPAAGAQKELVRALAQLGAHDAVRRHLDDETQPSSVRAEALRQLEATGAAQPEPWLQSASARAKDDPALAAAARQVLTARAQQQQAAAAEEQRRQQEAEARQREAEERRAELARTAEEQRRQQEARRAAQAQQQQQAQQRRAEQQRLSEVRRQGAERRSSGETPPRPAVGDWAGGGAGASNGTAGVAPSGTATSAAGGLAAKPVLPAVPPPPRAPTGPRDGTALAVVSSTLAGAGLMRNLALLGMNHDLGAEVLLGTSGAVIGAGTALGLARFGLRPTLAQAAWFTNVTAWGTLAGALAYAGSGSGSYKLQYGSLVLGEVAGMGIGAWSAHRWKWTPQQMVLANSLVLGAGLAAGGARRIYSDESGIGLMTALGTPAAMVAASIVARQVDPSTNDLHLIGVAAASGAWEGALIASGATGTTLLGSHQGQGGLALGLGIGYLAGVAAAPFVEQKPYRLYLGAGGLLAGNALGYGIHRAVSGFQHRDDVALPDDYGNHWALGAGLGGAALGLATLGYLPHAKLGPRALDMSLAGALYGGLTWTLATRTASLGSNADAVADIRNAGTLAASVAGAGIGLLASRAFSPDGADQAATAAASAAGLSAGFGLASLLSSERDVHGAGLAAGAALGFASGATLTHASPLRGPDVGAAVLTASEGALIGVLAPTLGSSQWSWNRSTRGGLSLGLGAGALLGAGVAHAAGASGAQVGVTGVATMLGLGMGAGAGLMWPDHQSQALRLGIVTGSGSMLLVSALAEHRLRLADGLGPSATGLGLFGAVLGAGYGFAAADISAPGADESPTTRQRVGGTMLGASAGLASGLVLARKLNPDASDYAKLLIGSLLGRAAGDGLAGLTLEGDRRKAGILALGGTAAGFVGGAVAAHHLDLRAPDVAAGIVGATYGTLLGGLAVNLGPKLASDRVTFSGAELGLAAGTVSAIALSHGSHASGGQVTATSLSGLLGMGMGLGAGLMWPTDDLRAARIGVVAGGAGLMATQLMAERWLRLGDGLQLSAVPLSLFGAGLGAAYGYYAADIAAPDAASEPSSRQRKGGALLGGSAGVATGLVLSKWLAPRPGAYWLALAGSLAGRALGLGTTGLLYEADIRRDGVGALAGTTLGVLGGALAANAIRLREPDVGGMVVGAGYGALFGALAPGFGPENATERHTTAGANVGGALGAVAGTALAHALDASGAQVRTTTITGVLGMGMGLGAGLMSRTPTYQGARIGTVAGGAALMAAQIALERRLELADGLGPAAPSMGLLGVALGAGSGLAAVGIVQRPDQREIHDRQVGGALLLGASAGLTTGLFFSKWAEPTGLDYGLALGGSLAGHALGAGFAALAFSHDDQRDAAFQLGGSLLGVAAAGTAAHRLTLTGPDLGAFVLGGAYGALFGGMAPSLGATPAADRRTAGGTGVGTALGAAGGLALSHALQATGDQVTTAGVAGLLGIAIGTGAGMMWPVERLQPTRIGVVAGGAGLIAASILAEPHLHLSEGLGPSAAGMSLLGGGMGTIIGLRGARTLSSDGVSEDRQLAGGALAGAATGLTAGLVLSQGFQPGGVEYTVTAGSTLAGAELGRGLIKLSYDANQLGERADAAAELAGSLAGLAGGMAAAHWLQLRPIDITAAAIGGAYGVLLGQGAPNLGSGRASDRRTVGGAEAGFALGALGASAATYLTNATPGQLAVPTVAGLLGIGAGYGAGMLWQDAAHGQAVRVGGFVGPLAMAAAALVMDRPLRLSDGLPERAAGVGPLGAAFGGVDGYLLAGAVTPGGLEETSAARAFGGVLAGSSIGLAAGLAVSKTTQLGTQDFAVISGGKLMGGVLGGGIGLLASSSDRPAAVGALAGSLLGMVGTTAAQRVSPLEGQDVAAAAVGLGWGTLVGTLLPNLNEPEWNSPSRRAAGGAMIGVGAGAIAGATLAHATGADGNAVALTALGATDGLLAGVGVGLMTSSDAGTRWGAVLGSSAGVALGATVWPHIHLDGGDGALMAATSVLGAWNAAWLPAFGHPALKDVSGRKVGGGVMAGAGIGLAAGTLMAPFVQDEDHDLLENAVAMDALWSGAGLGIGALASPRADVRVAGMLGGGAAGLLMGAALHRRIELDERSRPLLWLAGIEGAWLGAWLPYALHAPDQLSASDRPAGLAAGLLGGLGLGVVLSTGVEVSGRDALVAGTTSGIGAALGGGTALLAGAEMSGRAKTSAMLGGTAAGLLGGALLAPRLDFRDRGVGAASLGALMGASEGLVFAWAGRSSTTEQYVGAGLVGAGVGASLGLAGAANPSFAASQAPSAAGFAAWGAWMGAWSGVLVRQSAHEVVFGGLIGADVGFAAGYGLLRTGLVEPRDFGWLSLFGAMGTVAGAGAGATFSTTTDRRPIWVGLAAGPAVGMTVGGFVLPRLRALGERLQTASLSWRRVDRSVSGYKLDAPGTTMWSPVTVASSEVLPSDAGRSLALRAGRVLRSVIDVTEWAPMAGALPTSPDVPGPPPFLVGVTGLFK